MNKQKRLSILMSRRYKTISRKSLATDMTSALDSSLIQMDDPLAENAFPKALKDKWREEREQVRQVCVAEYSSSPLWQNRPAAQQPEYWKTFYVGRINL